MPVTIEEIKKLRESTGAGMADCKNALEDSGGDFDKAIEVLRKKGAATSAKRAERDAKEGFVAVYSHGGRIGSMVELNCETDFVSRNEDFRAFAMDLAMQVAAQSPDYVSRNEVPKEEIEKERKLELEKAIEEGKPKEIAKKIAEGKIDKYFERVCLLEQPFIKDPSVKVQDLLNEKLASIGEKLEIRRISRFELGK